VGRGVRFALAAFTLGLAMVAMRLTLPRCRALLGVLLYGALIFGGAFSFAYYALDHIHAGLGQTLLALVPLATVLLAVIYRQERLRAAAVVGTLLSVAGVGVVSEVSGHEAVPALSLLAVLGAVFCFAQATVLVRHFPSVHPVTPNALGMAVGAVLLIVLAFALRQSITLPEQDATWLALACMVLLGSGPVFVLYVVVVRLWSASRAAYKLRTHPARHSCPLGGD
jgi:drug/metabolite transporter (DMT)-like permease